MIALQRNGFSTEISVQLLAGPISLANFELKLLERLFKCLPLPMLAPAAGIFADQVLEILTDEASEGCARFAAILWMVSRVRRRAKE